MRAGLLAAGAALPTTKQLAARYSVSVGTAHRAVALLGQHGHVELGGRGRPTTVTARG
ncbi:GntR family transcriptional regulator [Pseudonocardia xishanensis]|uniref:GntR family transcriptional regulator n=1 Tax=Pseudonocardia xishanensis TaxID=630995 RepID=UPI003CD0914A